jgi:hypothetical protein
MRKNNLETDDGICFICGDGRSQMLQEHHVVPRRFGGKDTERNLVTVCVQCHYALEKVYTDEVFKRLLQRLGHMYDLQLDEVAQLSEEHGTIWELSDCVNSDELEDDTQVDTDTSEFSSADSGTHSPHRDEEEESFASDFI